MTESLVLCVLVAVVGGGAFTSLGTSSRHAIAGDASSGDHATATSPHPPSMAVSSAAGTEQLVEAVANFANTKGKAALEIARGRRALVQVRQTLPEITRRLTLKGAQFNADVPKETRATWNREATALDQHATKTQSAAAGVLGYSMMKMAMAIGRDTRGKSMLASAAMLVTSAYGYQIGMDAFLSMSHWAADQYTASLSALRESRIPALRNVAAGGEFAETHHMRANNVVGKDVTQLNDGGITELQAALAFIGANLPMTPLTRSIFLGQSVAGIGAMKAHELVHRYPSDRKKPPLLKWMQDKHLVMSQHTVHHTAPYNVNWGVVSGLTDPAMNKFYRVLERQLFLRMRVVPSSWVIAPETVPADLWPLIAQSPSALAMFEDVAKTSPRYAETLTGYLAQP